MGARWSSLALSAHRNGALDYAKYRRYDAYWELREELVLRAEEDHQVCRLNEMTHLWHSSAGAPTGWEEDSSRIDFHRVEANKAFRDVGRLLLPWYKRWSQDEGRELVDMYKAFKDREKDPAYAALLKKRREKVNARVAQFKAEAALLEELRKERAEERNNRDREQRRRRKRARLRRPTR